MKLRKLSQPVLLLIAGFLLGQMIGIHNRKARRTLLKNRCNKTEKVSHKQKKTQNSDPVKGNSTPDGKLLFDPVSSQAGRGTLMVGIMTTHQNLATRASALYSTWGREVPGRIVFYVGQNKVYNRSMTLLPHREPVKLINNLPVVELEGISDNRYPPRNKSFAMLDHMFHNFRSQYQWFFRGDDDLYVRLEELVKYLLSIDNSRPWYIGHPAWGLPSERGPLGLEKPFCMGGPGLVFSPLALKLLAPRLRECAKESASNHEDTELGRCVWKHLHIQCSGDRQRGPGVFRHIHDIHRNLNRMRQVIPSVLTLHPGKKPETMYNFHFFAQLKKLQNLQGRYQQLLCELSKVNNITMNSNTKSSLKRLHNLVRHHDVEDFLKRKLKTQQEAQKVSSKNLLKGIFNISKVWDWFPKDAANIVNNDVKNASDWDSIRSELLLNFGPVWEYIVLDKTYVTDSDGAHPLEEVLVKTASKTALKFRNSHGLSDLLHKHPLAKYQCYTLIHGLQHFIAFPQKKGYQSFLLSSKFEDLQWRETDKTYKLHDTVAKKNDENTGLKSQEHQLITPGQEVHHSSSTEGSKNTVISPWPKLYVLLPLYSFYQTYPKFLGNLTAAATRYPANVYLRVALYADTLAQLKPSLSASSINKNLNVTVHNMKGNFSRGVNLTELAEGIQGNSILIFLDVDLIVNEEFLFRAAINGAPGQAYFPISFSLYWPQTDCYGHRSYLELLHFSPKCGSWQGGGFRVVAMTAGDLRKTGGLSTDISGRGGKDADFYQRCLSRNIQILRTPDTGLVHVGHSQSHDQSWAPLPLLTERILEMKGT